MVQTTRLIPGAALVAAVLASSSLNAGDPAAGNGRHEKTDMHVLQFDDGGRLLSAPPGYVFTGSEIRFSFSKDRRSRDSATAQLIDNDLEGIRAIAEAGERERKPIEDFPKVYMLATSKPAGDYLFGLTLEDLKIVKEGLCQRVASTLRSDPTLPDAGFFKAEAGRLGCPENPVSHQELMPPATMEEEAFEVTVRPFTRDDVGIIDEKPEEPLKPEKPQTFVFKMKDAKCTEESQCGRVRFEIRQRNRLFSAAKEWADANQPSEGLVKSIKKAAKDLGAETGPVAIQGKYREVAKKVSAFLAGQKSGGPKLERPPVSDDDVKAVTDARAEARTIAREVSEKVRAGAWLAKWFWLTHGQGSLDPFGFTTNPGKQTKGLKEKRDRLASLDAEIASFELIAKNQGLNLGDLTKVVENLPALASKRVERDRLAGDLDKTKGLMQSAEERAASDRFLYEGLLLVSSKRSGGGAPMRHHDATNRYLDMSPSPVREIPEDERMNVLVENESPDSELRLDVVEAPVLVDLSPLSKELELTKARIAPAAGPDLKEFLGNYGDLEGLVGLLSAVLELPTSNPRGVKASTPLRHTQVVSHEIRAEAPTIVTYAIKKKEGAEEKEVGKGEYRINRYYWVRFKTGILYSFLNRSLTEERNRFGTDATFGIQVYLPKADIRSRKVLPGAYFGLSMRSPLNNLYIGGVAECFRGVSFIGGVHIGQIKRNESDPNSADVWKGGPFVSVSFDPEVLKDLIGLKPAF
jgi:hypothetical protein